MSLWNALRTLAPGCPGSPWLLMGDLNAVLYTSDRMNGNPITFPEIRDLAQILDDLQLYELKSSGSFDSWSSKGQGDNRVYSRIDRAFGNDVWMQEYGSLTFNYKPPSVSADHCPLVLQISEETCQISKPFIFFIWPIMQISSLLFNKVGKRRLQGGTGLEDKVKMRIKKLHHEELQHTTKRIDETRQALHDTQLKLQHCPNDIDLQEQERLFRVGQPPGRQAQRVGWRRKAF